jgi:hypothetical protein
MPWLQQWLFVFCQNMYCGLLMWERHTILCTHQFPAQHSVLPKLSVKLLFDVVMQQHLMNMVHNAQVDDVLLILAVADAHGALHLHSMCLQVIAHSELSILTLEKQLSKSAMEEVVDLRCRLGVPELDMDSPQAKQCKRIYRQCSHLISHLGLRFWLTSRILHTCQNLKSVLFSAAALCPSSSFASF